jgi:hypothetical protein
MELTFIGGIDYSLNKNQCVYNIAEETDIAMLYLGFCTCWAQNMIS